MCLQISVSNFYVPQNPDGLSGGVVFSEVTREKPPKKKTMRTSKSPESIAISRTLRMPYVECFSSEPNEKNKNLIFHLVKSTVEIHFPSPTHTNAILNAVPGWVREKGTSEIGLKNWRESPEVKTKNKTKNKNIHKPPPTVDSFRPSSLHSHPYRWWMQGRRQAESMTALWAFRQYTKNGCETFIHSCNYDLPPFHHHMHPTKQLNVFSERNTL